MNAIIFRGTALKHGTEVKLEVGFDSTGPYIATNGVQMTSDDIMASEHYMVVDLRGSGYRKLADLWTHMNNATYVFEAGIDMNWDGTMREELFTTFEKAEQYNISLIAEGDLYVDEVFIYARELK